MNFTVRSGAGGTNHTLVTGDTCLIALFCNWNGGSNTTTCTWDGVSMTAAVTFLNNPGWASIFFLNRPSIGNFTFSRNGSPSSNGAWYLQDGLVKSVFSTVGIRWGEIQPSKIITIPASDADGVSVYNMACHFATASMTGVTSSIAAGGQSRIGHEPGTGSATSATVSGVDEAAASGANFEWKSAIVAGGKVIIMMSRMRDFYDELKRGLISPDELQKRYGELVQI